MTATIEISTIIRARLDEGRAIADEDVRALLNENEKLREALRPFIQTGNVQVGYRVKLDGQEPPPITASEEEAWAHYGGSEFHYQQWLQWRADQVSRAALGETQ